MQQASHKKTGIFSDRKVSTDQAIKVLRKNGIDANEKQAKVILDFLYFLAKMYRGQASSAPSDSSIPEKEIEHKIII
ncbi:hypothetical protein DCC81_14505 [Chitinophaga parva]|uniref:PTS sugar transporter subunit IIBC n=1 Tax=Chitinophaga parva TaxID=2169414 RepID=A0A2T7BGX5_9BACT|nr:hypothetical protein [Chitinophaga parva]PUZ25493.1 hypothetical protein DCC81_14505 [Chitinophaga parva]